MRLKVTIAAVGIAGVLALLAAPADAQTRRPGASDHTVVTTYGEDGRRRTRVIIQKRSYLDPGTETFAGERKDHEYAYLPGQSGISVMDNTPFGRNQSSLPSQFSIPSRNTPWLQF